MDKYNTFGPRFFALIIDGIILGLIDLIIHLIPFSNSSVISIIVTMISSNIPYLYSILMLGRFGQTVGKMLLNVKVVDNLGENKIGYYQAFMRESIPVFIVNTCIIMASIITSGVDLENYEFSVLENIILFIPSVMLLLWSLTEIITMLFNAKNRALHDIIANTVVIMTDSKLR
ncbi:MAG: RDD family protein [Bacteroidota bacterium]|nr:RDD family protein [Bacteroidota bacterium]